MPISKPDHVQVHRIEFGKGTNINGLVKELETSARHLRYGAYATAGALGITAAGLTYGLYKIGQGIAGFWEDFNPLKAVGEMVEKTESEIGVKGSVYGDYVPAPVQNFITWLANPFYEYQNR